MWRKIGLYFLSLWLLFFLIIIITVDLPICFGENWEFVGISYLITHNIIPILCILALIVGWISYHDFKFKLEGTAELAFEITEIENINYEHLTFLTTYIVPLVCFNFGSLRYQFVLFILLIVIGAIYVKTDLFYANPTLALLKFRIYKIKGNFVNGETRENIILITREVLNKGNKVKYIKLDQRIYYAKKLDHE